MTPSATAWPRSRRTSAPSATKPSRTTATPAAPAFDDSAAARDVAVIKSDEGAHVASLGPGGELLDEDDDDDEARAAPGGESDDGAEDAAEPAIGAADAVDEGDAAGADGIAVRGAAAATRARARARARAFSAYSVSRPARVPRLIRIDAPYRARAQVGEEEDDEQAAAEAAVEEMDAEAADERNPRLKTTKTRRVTATTTRTPRRATRTTRTTRTARRPSRNDAAMAEAGVDDAGGADELLSDDEGAEMDGEPGDDEAPAADDEGATAGSDLKRTAVDDEDAPDSVTGPEEDAQPPAKKARS